MKNQMKATYKNFDSYGLCADWKCGGESGVITEYHDGHKVIDWHNEKQPDNKAEIEQTVKDNMPDLHAMIRTKKEEASSAQAFSREKKSLQARENSTGKIWFGTIPDCFGYGIAVIEDTQEKCRLALKKDWDETLKARKDYIPYNFPQDYESALDYFGGFVTEIEKGKAYCDGFKS